MKVGYAEKRLSKIATDEAYKLGLPISVINSARKKIVLLEQAPDERTIRNWRSLNFKKLSGDRNGQKSIRVNDQYRIIFTLDNDGNPPLITILEIDDTH
ncbi:type II toxin-antitoxin system RelE/ParE family toxin [Altererythrobacter aquiaggeris]|uniref:type II toxin-antitoxin system RelE/ParE family toxin n=1 Tax=Aestuarierythrobacter aquiaggeris TaxID=1898396 RepID=UPI003016111F